MNQVDYIMALAAAFATARVRRYSASLNQGDTNHATREVDAAQAALRAAVEALMPAQTATLKPLCRRCIAEGYSGDARCFSCQRDAALA